jgi:hypothetical protein
MPAAPFFCVPKRRRPGRAVELPAGTLTGTGSAGEDSVALIAVGA